MSSEKTRRIFDAAIDVFSEHGFDKAKMDDIAAQAGVAKGTVYYHFKSKEDLFVFLVEEGTELLRESVLSKVSNEASALENLRLIIREELGFFKQYRDFCIIMLRESWGEEGRQREFRRMLVHFVSAIRDVVKAGVDAGELTCENPEAVAWSIHGAVSMTALHHLFLDPDYDLPVLASHIERVVLYGLTARDVSATQ